MNKVAFYAMNLKGYFVLKKFIEKFEVNSISCSGLQRGIDTIS
jgi:hypothetical protein